MQATVRIITDREEMALYIPNQAVFDDQGYTVVFPRSDLPNPRIVLLGQQNLDFVQVLEGLEQGEEISLTDPRGLSKKETESVPTVGGTPGGPAGRNTPR
jgi:multidrug efflux pump subunit AcrA (membrane-fusion protein)